MKNFFKNEIIILQKIRVQVPSKYKILQQAYGMGATWYNYIQYGIATSAKVMLKQHTISPLQYHINKLVQK